MRNTVRAVLTWLLVGGVGAIIVAVLGEWFIHVAEDKGWYSDAGRTWDRVMASIIDFATSAPLLYSVTALGGLVAGVWLDTLLARRERPSRSSAPLALVGEIVEYHPAEVQSAALALQPAKEYLDDRLTLQNIANAVVGKSSMEASALLRQFKYKWVIVTAYFDELIPTEDMKIAVSASLEPDYDISGIRLFCFPDGKTDYLFSLSKGDVVQIDGEIISINLGSICLSNCVIERPSEKASQTQITGPDSL